MYTLTSKTNGSSTGRPTLLCVGIIAAVLVSTATILIDWVYRWQNNPAYISKLIIIQLLVLMDCWLFRSPPSVPLGCLWLIRDLRPKLATQSTLITCLRYSEVSHFSRHELTLQIQFHVIVHVSRLSFPTKRRQLRHLVNKQCYHVLVAVFNRNVERIIWKHVQ